MEEIVIEQSYRVFYITADSFPNGVLEAHQRLHKLLPSTSGRSFYGISNRDISGAIIYRAATKELYPGESAIYRMDVFTIQKGTYLSYTLRDFSLRISMIGNVFSSMLADEQVDDNGYCLEIYLNERDMQCLVKLKDQ
ncbi:MAG: transcriptional regulator [Saprospiraceae bacterium]|nr:transcriptional regulator [Saprospiraceae bacterium]